MFLFFLGIYLLFNVFTFTFDSFIGLEKISRMLIERGVNINAVDEKNNSALILAVVKGETKFLLLSKKGRHIVQFQWHINLITLAGYESIVKILVDNGASVYVPTRQNDTNDTSIISAIKNGIHTKI